MSDKGAMIKHGIWDGVRAKMPCERCRGDGCLACDYSGIEWASEGQRYLYFAVIHDGPSGACLECAFGGGNG